MRNMKNGTICDKHKEIMRLADLCLEDGQKMEQGLDHKRERIKELEEEVRELRGELSDATRHIQDLEEQLKDAAMERQA